MIDVVIIEDMVLKISVMSVVVSGGSTWDIIAVNVKRPFQLKSSAIL
jgi:hypothetical protein